MTEISSGTSPLKKGDTAASPWFTVTQDAMNAFAQCTVDPDPMHIDPAWAVRNSPYGGTIAFGFWTMSMLTHLLNLALEGRVDRTEVSATYYMNYGFDRMRLSAPIAVGSRIRGTFRLSDERTTPQRHLVQTLATTIVAENSERPALVGDWLVAWVTEPDRASTTPNPR